ncbi:hypothetical protein [Sulfuracidifex tepidarius]|uniref:Protein kinase domain-containing protein n=1 Tax=Sulfuracidifex tepidarius TaxID=1294262 RepID=A0A510DY88_9CREN|nr:hypothetical protein [Sulfuracidifex tepidarius]BBG24918.1 hypothetical protein IC006_2252 [Sulfuracidifex tepidarius]BBG27703.1 hypothetical protein IC007_2257 [Sulfuracidifex tepidarius]
MRDSVETARVKLMGWNFSVDPSLDYVIKQIVSVDPSKRPTAREVLNMIRGVNSTIC